MRTAMTPEEAAAFALRKAEEAALARQSEYLAKAKRAELAGAERRDEEVAEATQVICPACDRPQTLFDGCHCR